MLLSSFVFSVILTLFLKFHRNICMYLEVLPTVIFYIFKIRPVSLCFLKVVDKYFLFKFKPRLVWMLCLFFSCVFEFFFRAFVCLCVSLSTLLDLCVSLISTNVKTHRIPKRKKVLCKLYGNRAEKCEILSQRCTAVEDNNMQV